MHAVLLNFKSCKKRSLRWPAGPGADSANCRFSASELTKADGTLWWKVCEEKGRVFPLNAHLIVFPKLVFFSKLGKRVFRGIKNIFEGIMLKKKISLGVGSTGQ